MSRIHRTLMMRQIRRPFGVRRLMVDQSEKNLSFYFPLFDSFLSGIDKYILPGVEIRIKLTRSISQFVLLHNNVSSKSVGNYSLQIVSASLSVHMLELRSESFLSIEKALLKKKLHNTTTKTS